MQPTSEVQIINGTAKHFGSPIFFSFAHRAIGPYPIQLVVVTAVRKAVSAATITFTATSTIRFVFIIINYQLSIIN